MTKSGQDEFTQLQWKYFARVLPRIQGYITFTQKRAQASLTIVIPLT